MLDDAMLRCALYGHVRNEHIKPGERVSKPPAPVPHGPLKPAVFYILLALAERDSHGYAVMQSVREQSAGQIPLRTGSFYRHLAHLIEDGLVAESDNRPASDDPRRGTYYRLTSHGHAVLGAERRRLASLVAVIDRLQQTPRRGQA
jgi:DNA-binding PadR family transcriptional regulator